MKLLKATSCGSWGDVCSELLEGVGKGVIRGDRVGVRPVKGVMGRLRLEQMFEGVV